MCVRPPSKIKATTPLVIIAKHIIPLDLTLASNARYRYVFSVPPSQSTKNIPAVPSYIVCIIFVKA